MSDNLSTAAGGSGTGQALAPGRASQVQPLVPATGGGPGPAAEQGTALAKDETSKTDTFSQRVVRAAANIVILRVTTVVGDLEITGADDLNRPTTVVLRPGSQQVASLSINTALGDSTLMMSQAFVDNPTYRALHDDAVKSAEQVRANSITLLREIWQDFKTLLER